MVKTTNGGTGSNGDETIRTTSVTSRIPHGDAQETARLVRNFRCGEMLEFADD